MQFILMRDPSEGSPKMKYLLLLGLILSSSVMATKPQDSCKGQCDDSVVGDTVVGVETVVGITSDVDTVVGVETGDTNVSNTVGGGDTILSAGDTNMAGGDTSVNFNSSDEFFAFSTGFPNASGCFTGGQGGDGSTFLGLHFLNTSCWLNTLAESETHLDIRARLKCGDRKYRNAIAYDSKGIDRREACIAFVSERWLKEIQNEKEIASKCKTGVCSYINGQLHFYEEE